MVTYNEAVIKDFDSGPCKIATHFVLLQSAETYKNSKRCVIDGISADFRQNAAWKGA